MKGEDPMVGADAVDYKGFRVDFGELGMNAEYLFLPGGVSSPERVNACFADGYGVGAGCKGAERGDEAVGSFTGVPWVDPDAVDHAGDELFSWIAVDHCAGFRRVGVYVINRVRTVHGTGS